MRVLSLIALSLILIAQAAAAAPPAPRVDIALLLDTSNSMDGLIAQAKSQLWLIVHQFAIAQRDGQAPVLRVALFEYGNTNLPAKEGYIRQVVPLTDDLDKLSQALFSLTTQGGDEYCGQVIDEAIKRLDWASEPGAYKAIFIAGNEPFTQGTVDYHVACANAQQKNTIVNTIHCGPRDQGIAGRWQDGALLGKGEFFNIDQDRRLPDIHCPQDALLAKLNNELNATYLWFGDDKTQKALAGNQVAQDANASSVASVTAAQRIATKGGNAYQNVGRDLVDSYAQDNQILTKVKVEELPEAMRNMTAEQREEHVKKMSQQRNHLKNQIGKLATERESYYQGELKKLPQSDADKTLGDVMAQTVQKQLEQAGFSSTR